MARRSLGENVVASAANVVAVVGASLVAVPLLIDRLGLAGYGLWALAQSLVVYVTTAELGFGPALARFTSVRAAQRERLPQVLVAAVVLYGLVGGVAVAGCHLLAEPLVGLFPVPERFHAEAVATVGLMGWVSLAALLAAAFGHVLSGLERFRTFTVTNALGSIAFLFALLVLVGADASLTDVAHAALLQWGIVALARLALLHDVMRTRGRRVPERALLRDLFGFSLRLQASVLATLLNTQTDRLVIGLVASATTLGQASVATQLAEAARFLGYAAFTPMASRMATTFATSGRPALDEALRRYREVWVVAALGATAIGVGAVRPAIAAWLGPGHDEAALFAALLVAGYGVGLLPSADFAYRRALGDPGIEGAFGVVTVVLNVVATIVLGVLAGAIGVVVATLVAYLTSTLWVSRRLRGGAAAGVRSVARPLRTALSLAFVAAASYGVGEGLVALLPRIVALAGLGVVAVALLGLHLLVAMGRSPAQALAALRGGQLGTGAPTVRSDAR